MLNANTPERGADQYTSMVLERTVVDRVKRAPAFVQMFPSSEVTPSALSPGLQADHPAPRASTHGAWLPDGRDSSAPAPPSRGTWAVPGLLFQSGRSTAGRPQCSQAMSDNERKSATDVSKSDKRKQSLYFPETMLDEIQKEAQRLQRSMSWVVQRAWKHAGKEIKGIPGSNEPGA